MRASCIALFLAAVNLLFLPAAVAEPPSPELVKQIQADLKTLGYDPGPADGALGTKTQLAIGQFEADRGLPFTGQPSLELAFKLREAMSSGNTAAATAQTEPAKTVAELQQECFQKAQEEQKKKKKWGAFSNLGKKLANRFGDYETAKDIHDAAATVNDVSSVAKEFGISESAAEQCIKQSQGSY